MSEDRLWTREGPGWTGGDGTYSVALPGGRSAWIFGDTFLGTVNRDGSRSRSTPFIHNSLVVEKASRLYDLVEGTQPTLVTSGARAGSSSFYWPGAGLVQNNELRLFVHRFRSTGSGMWNFTYTGTAVAMFSLPALSLMSVTPVASSSTIQWGSWVLEDGPFTYIYGAEDQTSVKYLHVARVRADAISAPWQYYDGRGWSFDPRSSARLLPGVSNQFSVVRIGRRYELISQDDEFSRSISAYSGATPVGPFGSKTVLYTTPDWGPDSFTYNAVAHPEQGWAGGLLLSYNVNSLNQTGDYADAELYRPHFVRVPVSCFPR